MIREVIYFSNNKKWIIGAIARESISESRKYIKTTVFPNSRLALANPIHLFQSKIRSSYSNVLFLGASTFFTIIESRPNSNFINCRVFFTHLIREMAPTPFQIDFLNRLDKIFTMNTSSANILRECGVTTEIIVVYGAINEAIFHPSDPLENREPFVLITSHAAPRKRPELILQFIEDSPDINFVIHGKFWDVFETQGLANLKVKPFNYLWQPDLMRSAAVFLSISWVEGGPFPILEALASGTPVVSTITGFAPDLIQECNGRLIEDPSDFVAIRQMINECISLKSEVSNINLLPLDLSWKTLSKHFYE
jgi:glycosyltransferase involved in cell wall biosynthesis